MAAGATRSSSIPAIAAPSPSPAGCWPGWPGFTANGASADTAEGRFVHRRTGTVQLSAVGLDACRGFCHQPRHGRPALALDMMEPFRPLVADSAVLPGLNNGEVGPGDALLRAGAVGLTPSGRRAIIATFERRPDQEITHPVFGCRIAHRRLFEVQARLPGRFLAGEIPELPHITPRQEGAMRDGDHLWVVTYDVGDQKRWRRVLRVMKGRGEWLQLSVFQCRLSRRGMVELRAALSEIVNNNQDHVLFLDLGPADEVKPRVSTLGRRFEPVERRTIIV